MVKIVEEVVWRYVETKSGGRSGAFSWATAQQRATRFEARGGVLAAFHYWRHLEQALSLPGLQPVDPTRDAAFCGVA